MMTFKQFQATRRFKPQIPDDVGSDSPSPCFLYVNDLHIEISIGEHAGQFCCTIGNWSECSYNLTELEAELYNFYTHNTPE